MKSTNANLYITPSPALRASSPARDEGKQQLFTSPLAGEVRRSRDEGGWAHGFTLIELLVVVLIVGILAAVAVPQYQKAVEKSRAAEAISVLNTLRKGVDLYVLEHGYPTSGYISILGESSDADANVSLDLTLDNTLICTEDSAYNAYCYSKDFAYTATCFSTACSIGADRISGFKHTTHDYEVGDLSGGRYSIFASKSASTGQWEYFCIENNEHKLNICNALESLGWK